MTTQAWLSHTRQITTSKIYGHSMPLTATYLSTSTTIPAFGFSVGDFIAGLNPIGELIEALWRKCRVGFPIFAARSASSTVWSAVLGVNSMIMYEQLLSKHS